MQMTINNSKGGQRKKHQKCFCSKNARTFTLFTRNSSITIYEDELGGKRTQDEVVVAENKR